MYAEHDYNIKNIKRGIFRAAEFNGQNVVPGRINHVVPGRINLMT